MKTREEILNVISELEKQIAEYNKRWEYAYAREYQSEISIRESKIAALRWVVDEEK